jgi:Domain of unknown function (DUF4160)
MSERAIGRWTIHPFMPTIKGIPGPYRFFFYSSDCNEPAHVHVWRDRATCKFWIDPLQLARSTRFAPHELSEIRRVIFEYRRQMLEAWREHCSET